MIPDTHVPVLTLMIATKTVADRERLRVGLSVLKAEDPTLHVHTNSEVSQAIIGVSGELQLEIICDRLHREFGVEARVGKPQVAHREALTNAADGEMKYARQSAGRGQYAHVKIHLFPGAPGTGYVFENKIVGGAIPTAYIESIDDGIKEALALRKMAGYPIDVRIELYDGSYHEVDSSEMTFRIAGSLALQDAVKKAKPVLLEPVMRVEVIGPSEYVTEITGNLSSRRGQILSLEERGRAQTVNALVPLAEMFGYATDLRDRTLGRATYTMKFDRYEPVDVGPDENDDRSSYVAWPVTPRFPLKGSMVALPEPD